MQRLRPMRQQCAANASTQRVARVECERAKSNRRPHRNHLFRAHFSFSLTSVGYVSLDVFARSFCEIFACVRPDFWPVNRIRPKEAKLFVHDFCAISRCPSEAFFTSGECSNSSSAFNRISCGACLYFCVDLSIANVNNN